jgi:type I restriction enzyme S subunit
VTRPYPKVSLSSILRKFEEPVLIQPEETYKQVTVRLFHKGVVLRGQQAGAEIRTTRQWRIHAGQILLSRIDARNGAIGLVPSDLEDAIVTNDFWAFDVDREAAEPRFLDAYFGTPEFVDACKRASEGTTNRVRLQHERFLGITVPLPPLAEQRRILARIEELAAKIEEARALRRRSADEALAMVIAARARVFKEAEQNGKMSLADLAILERGKFSHRPRNDPRFFGGIHPWIQIAEIEAADKYIRKWTQTLNNDGLSISRKFPRGTVLISIAATIGAVGILDFDCCVPDSIVAVTPRLGTDSEYLYHYLIYVRSHLEQIAPQSAQKNINLEILSALPVPRLPLTEQRRIVIYLDDLEMKVGSLNRQYADTSAELDALLPSILDKAFKGEF